MIDHDRGLDNYVPRFGLLSTTRITPIVLIGIWMIFLPVTIVAAVAVVGSWSTSADLFSSFMSATLPAICGRDWSGDLISDDSTIPPAQVLKLYCDQFA